MKTIKFFSSKGVNSIISLIVLLSFLNLIACKNYYKVTEVPNNKDVVVQFQKEKRYIILHQGNFAWHFKNLVIDEQKQEIEGKTEPVAPTHVFYKRTNPDKANRYKLGEEDPLYEAHIFTSEYMELDSTTIRVPFTSINRIEVYDRDVGATTSSYVFGTLGVIAGALAIIFLIALATKSSCPFIYTYNNGQWYFKGELYGGAIYPSLERDDYMPLSNTDLSNNSCKIKISNQLLEKQNTDVAKLIVVDHPENSFVLLDKSGNAQTIVDAEKPFKAVSSGNADYTNYISKTDSSKYLFSDPEPLNKNKSSIVLSFNKPEKVAAGKLVVNLKNSYWLDYAYGEFIECFGTYYDDFVKKQKKVTAEKNIQWSLEQGIPLSVSVETKNGWRVIDYFNLVGPLAARDMVMPIDLGDVEGKTLNLKFECGLMFWELDYAAMDFSANIPYSKTEFNPVTAIDEKGSDVVALLSEPDHNYLFQPEIGNEVVADYKFEKPAPGMIQTVFLHTRGYYEYIRNFSNKPNFLQLKSFKRKEAFAKFSREKYFEFVNHPNRLANSMRTIDGH